MVTQKVEFRKIREVGANISDTFGFIKQELKPLMKSYLLIAGVCILVTTILLGILINSLYGGIFGELISGNTEVVPEIPEFTVTNIIISLLTLMMLPVTIAIINLSTTCYIKVYMDNGNNAPEFNEVWQEFTKHFWRVLLFSFLYAFAVFFGAMLCLVPGIYLSVRLFSYVQIIVFENKKSVGDIWRRSGELIKENFWFTLLLYILMSMITSFFASFLAIFVSVIIGLFSTFVLQNNSNLIGIIYSTIYFFSYLFYVILMTSMIMQYFNLAERRDGTGILQRIQNIGNYDTHPQTEERY